MLNPPGYLTGDYNGRYDDEEQIESIWVGWVPSTHAVGVSPVPLARNYDLKAINPHRKTTGDERPPEQILEAIEKHGREVAMTLKELRAR